MQIHAFLLEEVGRDTRRDHVSRLMPLIFPELRSPPKNSFLRQQFPRHDFLSPSNTGTEVIKSRVPERSCRRLRSVDDAFHRPLLAAAFPPRRGSVGIVAPTVSGKPRKSVIVSE